MQTKQIKFYITSGVQDLNLNEDLILSLVDEAAHSFNKNEYFIVFNKENDDIKVTDGNENLLNTIFNKSIPQNLWLIFDEYDEYFVATLLLPSEY